MGTSPQICHTVTWQRDDNGDQIKCLGASIWKLRCLSCKEIVGKDNICPVCSAKYSEDSALKDAQLKEDKRQNKIFLQGCCNVNTTDENMKLLVCGMVNELNDSALYNNFPIEINESILMFCFNHKLITDVKDTFWRNHSGTNRFRDGNTVVETLVKCEHIIEGTRGFGATNKTVRKVWTMQILNHEWKDKIELCVGIAKKNKT